MAERVLVFLGVDEPFFVEKREAARIEGLLSIIPHLKDWTLLAVVARRIGCRLDQAACTVRLLRAAERIEQEGPILREVLAEAPILMMKKDRQNKRKRGSGMPFLRAPIYIKKPPQTNVYYGGTP